MPRLIFRFFKTNFSPPPPPKHFPFQHVKMDFYLLSNIAPSTALSAEINECQCTVNIFENMHMWRGGGEVGTFRMWDTRKNTRTEGVGRGGGSKVTGLILDTLSLASIYSPPPSSLSKETGYIIQPELPTPLYSTPVNPTRRNPP